MHVLYKDFYTNVHSSFVYNSIELEITQMFISSSVDKQVMAYPQYRMLLFTKKERKDKLLKHTLPWMDVKIIMLIERTQTEAYCMTL